MSEDANKYGEPDEVRSRLAMFMAAALDKGAEDAPYHYERAQLAMRQAERLECEFRGLYDSLRAE